MSEEVIRYGAGGKPYKGKVGPQSTDVDQFSNLGSGFSIAMRDLDIRGAGYLLGADQSGFINEIGFEMYQVNLQLL